MRAVLRRRSGCWMRRRGASVGGCGCMLGDERHLGSPGSVRLFPRHCASEVLLTAGRPAAPTGRRMERQLLPRVEYFDDLIVTHVSAGWGGCRRVRLGSRGRPDGCAARAMPDASAAALDIPPSPVVPCRRTRHTCAPTTPLFPSRKTCTLCAPTQKTGEPVMGSLRRLRAWPGRVQPRQLHGVAHAESAGAWLRRTPVSHPPTL